MSVKMVPNGYGGFSYVVVDKPTIAATKAAVSGNATDEQGESVDADVWTAPGRPMFTMTTAEKAAYTGLSVREIEEMGQAE